MLTFGIVINLDINVYLTNIQEKGNKFSHNTPFENRVRISTLLKNLNWTVWNVANGLIKTQFSKNKSYSNFMEWQHQYVQVWRWNAVIWALNGLQKKTWNGNK